MSDNAHDVEIALLEQRMEHLTKEVHDLSKQVSGLVDAWTTASGVVAFVKWLSSAIVALGVIWAAVKIKIGS